MKMPMCSFSMQGGWSPEPKDDPEAGQDDPNTKLRAMSWNVNSWEKFGRKINSGLIQKHRAHILALQETRGKATLPHYVSLQCEEEVGKVNAALLIGEILQPKALVTNRNLVAARTQLRNNKGLVVISIYINVPADTETTSSK